MLKIFGMWINIPPLGDAVEKALSTVGITKERVSWFIGKPCRCKERQEKLNALSAWANRVLSGKTEDAEKHLHDLMHEHDANCDEGKEAGRRTQR